MTRVYRAAIGWRIFMTACGIPLVLGFGYFMLLPFLEGRTGVPGAVAFSLLIGGGFSAAFLIGVIAVLYWRVEVLPDRLRDVNLFKVRELAFSQIEGIKIVPTPYMATVEFVPRDPKAKSIKIGMMMGNREEFAAWVDATFRNLTAEELAAHVQTVLQDEALGENEEQRIAKVNAARKWARILDIAGTACLFWAMIFPRPYELAIGVSALIPIVALVSMRYFPGVLHFDVVKGSPHPTIARAFMGPPLALALRALQDFDIFSWQAFWVPFSVITAFLLVLVLIHAADVRRKVTMIIVALVFCAVYGYGATITLNGLSDRTPSTVYKAQVLSKRVSSGKGTTYYLKLSAWGPRTAESEVSVSKSVYESRKAGDIVRVLVFRGGFRIPWYYVR